MKTLKINHAAVWVLVLIHQIIGGIWYSPFAFANKWVELTGKSMADFSNASFMPYANSIVAAIILCYSIAWLFKKLEVTNFITGMAYSFLFWFAFLFMELLTFNSFELRPYGLTFIDAGKSLLTFLICGFVLGMWKRYESPEAASETQSN